MTGFFVFYAKILKPKAKVYHRICWHTPHFFIYEYFPVNFS